MIEVIMLGTSAMVPTKERNQTAILLSYLSEGILFDCGEGTQRQLKAAGIPITKITHLCISHLHGDHILGIPGLIQTMGMSEYTGTLYIYGPKGTEAFIQNMFKTYNFDTEIKIEVKEINEGTFLKTKIFKIESFPLNHGVPTVGFRFIETDKRKINVNVIKKLGIPDGPLLGKLQEGKEIKWKGKTVTAQEATYTIKGKIVSYIPDTSECQNCIRIAQDADLVISEATYTDQLKAKAKEYLHLTARQAALIANNAGAKKLVLTHFSQRYKNTQDVEEDARNVFDNIICAEDLMRIKV